jgi:hypothetical protein
MEPGVMIPVDLKIYPSMLKSDSKFWDLISSLEKLSSICPDFSILGIFTPELI